MVAPWLALQPIEVTYTGRRSDTELTPSFRENHQTKYAFFIYLSPSSAHAAYAPWEGQNALDAFHIAYGSIAVLRQQMKPELRVHGVLDSGHSLEPNGLLYVSLGFTTFIFSFPSFELQSYRIS